MTDTASIFGWLAGPRDRPALLAFLDGRTEGSAEQQDVVDAGFSITVVADAIKRDEAEISTNLWGQLVLTEAGRAALVTKS